MCERIHELGRRFCRMYTRILRRKFWFEPTTYDLIKLSGKLEKGSKEKFKKNIELIEILLKRLNDMYADIGYVRRIAKQMRKDSPITMQEILKNGIRILSSVYRLMQPYPNILFHICKICCKKVL